MKLSRQNRQTLLIDLHRIIEEQTQLHVNKIMDQPAQDRSIYPPDATLSDPEKEALTQLNNDPHLKSALEKVFKDTTATVLFRFFSAIDRTSNPDPQAGKWSGVMLVDRPKDLKERVEYLHDHFFECYWDWKEKFEVQDYSPLA